MKLKPGIGFDNVKFGMSRKEVLGILGNPNRIIKDDQEQNEEILEWNDLKVRITFQNDENGRFTYLRSINPKLEYKGAALIGRKTDYIKEKVFIDFLSEWEIEQFDFFQSHFYEKYWLVLISEYGEIRGVELGVPFKNEDDYEWPK